MSKMPPRQSSTRATAPATGIQTATDTVSDDRRQQLLDIAARLFGERGYRATTLRDIARAAGILPGSVYHHFASKAEIFVEVNSEGFRSLIAAVEAALVTEDDPWRRLEAAFTAHLDQLLSGRAVATLTNSAILSRDEAQLLADIQPWRNRYENIIGKLVSALPLKRGVDRTLLRLQLLGALNWTPVWYSPGKKSPAQIARHLVAAIRP